jgi:catechol 2,3-dioxygenase-like lactoylglutathione lyase family enzyme
VSFAQINHMAMISPDYALLGKFYEAMFGLRSAGEPRADSSIRIGDGYVGLNILPKRDGYFGGLDHFGIVVDDVQIVLERMQRKARGTSIVKRPSTRPFAAYSGHDPDGNVFDLAQKKHDKRSDIYAEQAKAGWTQDRTLNRFAIRTVNADACAEFYREVFELEPVARSNSGPGHHLSDGRVTLSILPWSIDLFEGMAIKRPGPDHIGVKVENLESFKAHVAAIAGKNSYLAPVTLGGSKESEVRKRLFQSSACGKWQMTDPDGTWIDITDE